jgi:hypothetical protein
MSIIADIKRANNLSQKHRQLVNGRIQDWFVKRYGVTFNEVDADELIDCVDYGQGGCPTTIKQIDSIMRLAGRVPLSESKVGSE